MDKFTKTTEIDISAMNDMEDETPKKGKAGTIIALIICLIASIFIWLLVMETENETIKKEYSEIPVKIEYLGEKNEAYDIIISDAYLDVVIEATRSDMADLSKDGITLTVKIPADFRYDEPPKSLTVEAKACGTKPGSWLATTSKTVDIQVVEK